MSLSSKTLIITLVLGLTLAYSLYEKKKFDGLVTAGDSEPVLKMMPDFNLNSFKKNIPLSKSYFSSSKASFVHFWGTWCAPCEAEFPEFLRFAEKFEKDNVKFLLLAINDNDKKIKKFLKRFGELPSNVVVAHDKSGASMAQFGTVRVPETYIFDSGFRNIKKFAGPQAWEMKSFYPRIKRLIFGH